MSSVTENRDQVNLDSLRELGLPADLVAAEDGSLPTEEEIHNFRLEYEAWLDRQEEGDDELWLEPRLGLEGDPDPAALGLVTIDQWLDLQASWYRSHGTVAADWLAGRIAALADLARGLAAVTFADLDERAEAIEEEERARIREEAWDAGVRYARALRA